EWNAGYRITDQNKCLVAGYYGYGLNPEEEKNWCDEQETSRWAFKQKSGCRNLFGKPTNH
ncbi:MAG: hypothetical protein QNL93_07240, partial [Opitutae bacterium]